MSARSAASPAGPAPTIATRSGAVTGPCTADPITYGPSRRSRSWGPLEPAMWSPSAGATRARYVPVLLIRSRLENFERVTVPTGLAATSSVVATVRHRPAPVRRWILRILPWWPGRTPPVNRTRWPAVRRGVAEAQRHLDADADGELGAGRLLLLVEGGDAVVRVVRRRDDDRVVACRVGLRGQPGRLERAGEGAWVLEGDHGAGVVGGELPVTGRWPAERDRPVAGRDGQRVGGRRPGGGRREGHVGAVDGAVGVDRDEPVVVGRRRGEARHVGRGGTGPRRPAPGPAWASGRRSRWSSCRTGSGRSSGCRWGTPCR